MPAQTHPGKRNETRPFFPEDLPCFLFHQKHTNTHILHTIKRKQFKKNAVSCITQTWCLEAQKRKEIRQKFENELQTIADKEFEFESVFNHSENDLESQSYFTEEEMQFLICEELLSFMKHQSDWRETIEDQYSQSLYNIQYEINEERQSIVQAERNQALMHYKRLWLIEDEFDERKNIEHYYSNKFKIILDKRYKAQKQKVSTNKKKQPFR